MAGAGEGQLRPTRGRMILATFIVILMIVAAWMIIDYRTQPPLPPNPVGALQR